MGTWAVDAFGNDNAADWALQLEEADDLSPIKDALDAVIEEDEDLEEGVAAIETLARLKGQWGERNLFSETVDAWVEAHPQTLSKAILSKATAALKRILGDSSDLKERWRESDHFDAWLAAMDNLKTRLNA